MIIVKFMLLYFENVYVCSIFSSVFVGLSNNNRSSYIYLTSVLKSAALYLFSHFFEKIKFPSLMVQIKRNIEMVERRKIMVISQMVSCRRLR